MPCWIEMIRRGWAPLAICSAVAFAGDPLDARRVTAGTVDPPPGPDVAPICGDEPAESGGLILRPPGLPHVEGTPVLVGPSCRPPRQSFRAESREWLVGLTLPDIPIERPDEVRAALDQLLQSSKGRSYVRASIRRSGRNAGLVAAALAARGLPRALLALPFLESGWNEIARSKAGASGLWQLMPQTARRLGLVVTREYDERRSPERSTEAALAHLADLHAKFGSWDLALAAYDRGQPGIERALRRNGVEDYWSLVDLGVLPEETRRYVAVFLALAILYDNPEKFAVEPESREPGRAVSFVEVPVGTPFSLLARAAGTSVRKLHLLSPEFFGSSHTTHTVKVAIPDHGLARARVMLPSLLAAGLDGFTADAPADFDWGRDERDREPAPPRSDGPLPRWALRGTTDGTS